MKPSRASRPSRMAMSVYFNSRTYVLIIFFRDVRRRFGFEQKFTGRERVEGWLREALRSVQWKLLFREL